MKEAIFVLVVLTIMVVSIYSYHLDYTKETNHAALVEYVGAYCKYAQKIINTRQNEWEKTPYSITYNKLIGNDILNQYQVETNTLKYSRLVKEVFLIIYDNNQQTIADVVAFEYFSYCVLLTDIASREYDDINSFKLEYKNFNKNFKKVKNDFIILN